MQTSDNELLGKFVRDNDEGSVLELVQRHAPMVMGVCQSLLLQTQDAEDAFQATFLVLANKAPRLLKHSSIAGWLHQVAVRNCRNLRRQKKRKREVELNQEPVVNANEPWKSISELHDREKVQHELSRLPKRYREVIVLCHIEGRSRSETAEILNCSTASVKASLARGRKLLKQRLIRHGIVASSVIGVLAAATQSSQAAMPCHMIESAIQICQGRFAETGGSSTSDLIQTLAQQEMTKMNFLTLSKSVACLALVTTLIGVPWALNAKAVGNSQASRFDLQPLPQQQESEPVEIGASEPDPVPRRGIGSTFDLPAEESVASESQVSLNQETSTGDPLLDASKDSLQYWELIRKATEARLKGLSGKIVAVQEGDLAESIHTIEASILEAQAKLVQIDLLMEKLAKEQSSDASSEDPLEDQAKDSLMTDALEADSPRRSERYVPPSPKAKIMPGEVLTVELNDGILITRRVIVMMDGAISLPLIGAQNTKGLDQLELKTILEQRYREYVKTPRVDVFRELPPRSGADIPLASTETLKPGETLSVYSMAVPSLNRNIIVQEGGAVTLPLLGVVQGEGLTPEELAKKLNVAAKKLVKSPQIEVFRGGIDDPREIMKDLQ